MKRDIKLNISQLKGISQKLLDYAEAVAAVGQAAVDFQQIIQEQDSDAYQKLAGLWEMNVKENAEELINRLSTVQYYLSCYITKMTSFITPDDENAMMRVDRNDIWFNYQQISLAATDYMDDILLDTGSSWKDYHKNYYYDRRLSQEENEAGRAAVEAEVEAERLRRERNYEKLAGFRSELGGNVTEQLLGYVKELKQIYDENVVPFENTDDEYEASLGIRYNEWCTAGDHFRDACHTAGNFFCGAGNALKDFVMGIAGLLGGAGKLLGYAGYSLLELAGLASVPDDLDADIQNMKDIFVQFMEDPGNALESVGQSMFDTADEKGVAYSAGYVATDVVIAIFTDKGLDKLKNAGKAGKTTKAADDVIDAVEDAGKAGKTVEKAADAAEEAGKAGKAVEKAADAAEDAVRAGNEAKEAAQKAGAVADDLDGNAGKVLESGTGVKYSPANPGPLNEEVANSFNGATYTERVLTEDTVMYRVSGGNAKEVGSYMSMTPQGGGLQSQLDLALNPAWGNTTENVTKVVVPKGTTIYEGVAAPQNIYDSLGNVIGTLPGGGNQVYIPKVEVGWFQ